MSPCFCFKCYDAVSLELKVPKLLLLLKACEPLLI